ncbi:histone deacetylase complex subunit SAP25 isoform X3 [Myotis myotis]|uniref:histone deacetylase complex subunit SAP25 isoform X3 n=1 Tax=Myotis myotis TaxID=51298 RepID=UPI00174EBC4F|nr:histone deacetylase complex subunit SAP25 isoform X3 [Myotis myotis]
MLPWPLPRWDGEEQAPEEQGPSPFGDPGKVRNSGGKALGVPGAPPQDSPQFRAPRPSWTRRGQRRAPPRAGLVAQQHPGPPGRCWALPPLLLRTFLPTPEPVLISSYPPPPVPLFPQMAWGVAPSRMTLLAPWDPNYEAKAGSQLVWGPSCASGASFSSRTLCHPSFWPLYEAASGRDRRPLTSATVRQNGEQAPRAAGFPVMCCEDVFLSDPLLPPGQRVPLYLPEAPQQVMGSLQLLLPPPIMSPQVCPTRSPGCCTTWLSGPELIALTGLLQMSQGEPRPSSTGSSAAPTPPSDPLDPVSDHAGPSGSHCTDPSLRQTPETNCP